VMNKSYYTEATEVSLTPDEILKQLDTLDAAETPSIALSFSEFVNQQYSDGEEIAFHGCRSELVVIESVTNHGKSTFLRNASFHLAAGRAFLPFINEGKPRKVYLLNFEGSCGRFRDDMKLMAESLTEEEMQLVNENLFLAHRPLIDGESLTLSLSQHLKLIEDDARKHNADIVIVDTASAGFDLRNENDNAEVVRCILKPLLQLGERLNCLVVLVHHIGQAGNESGNAREAAYRGRGASSFGCYATSVLNLIADGNDQNRVKVECAKRKDGERYAATLKLNRETRWFEVAEEKTPDVLTSYQKTLQSMTGVMKTSEIVEAGEKLGVSKTQTNANLKLALERGDLVRPDDKPQGWYAPKPKTFPISPTPLRTRELGENGNGAACPVGATDEVMSNSEGYVN
jgi:RecA-family ATPase